VPAIDRFLDILQLGPSDPTCVFNLWRDDDERDLVARRLLEMTSVDSGAPGRI
jgi:hypothetical protein